MSTLGFLHGKPSPAIVQIDALASLPPNWDSYEGAPIGEMARNRAKQFITYLERVHSRTVSMPIVGPTVDGGVVLIWREENRPRVEVFFSNEDTRYVVSKQQDIVERGRLGDVETFVREVMKRFIIR